MTAISCKDGPVAVTGCSGFTGGHLVRELVTHGYDVRACLRDSGSWRGQDCIRYLEGLPNVEIFDGCDLFLPGSYNDAFKDCSGVFHAAAVLGNSADGKSQPRGSGEVQEDVYEGGLSGTQNVIDAVNASGSVKRLIYTSSTAAVRPNVGDQSVPDGYEWTEMDWASDGGNKNFGAYARSKVDAEQLVNKAAEESEHWDVVTLNPAMICGPILFKAQVGQWIEQIGRLASGKKPNFPDPYDRFYDIIDVRDLVRAQLLAAESNIDHKKSSGGARYILAGTGGYSTMCLGTDITRIIRSEFPDFVVGQPETTTSESEPIRSPKTVHDCKKAKELLGVTIRPIQQTIHDVIESQIELGVIQPTKK